MNNANINAWEDHVAAEAMRFKDAVIANFECGLKNSLQFLPDKTNKDQLCRQLDYFIDVMAGVSVYNVTTWAASTKEMEELFVKAIRNKFEYVRKKQDEVKVKKLEDSQ